MDIEKGKISNRCPSYIQIILNKIITQTFLQITLTVWLDL